MEQKDCKDCEHYMQHYIKFNGRLKTVSGHCINTFANGRMRNADKICGEWLLKDTDKEKLQEKQQR